MFNESFKATIRRVGIKAIEDENNVYRKVMDVQLHIDFEQSIARGLNKKASQVQKLVADGDLKNGTLPVDALPELYAQFYAGSDQHVVKSARAAGAKVAIGKDGDDPPRMVFTISFSFTEEAMCYIARHLGEEVTVRLKRTQTTIPGTEDEATEGAEATAAA